MPSNVHQMLRLVAMATRGGHTERWRRLTSPFSRVTSSFTTSVSDTVDPAVPTAKKWILVKHFQGEPKDENLQLEEESLPGLKEGDVLLEGEWWSVDPYMRMASILRKPGSIMMGEQVARVIQSRNSAYPEGTLMLVNKGWRTHTICNPDTVGSASYQATRVPIIIPITQYNAELPDSLSLGVLGMPGATAYLGLQKICQPQPGETVLVSGAAGAVGSLVGQIAKLKGCQVIGFAGSDKKVKYLKQLGFDEAFNYKTCDVRKSLKAAAPGGIDCYFDNVGGDMSNQVIHYHLRDYGRAAVCGAVSRYNNDIRNIPTGPELYLSIVRKQLHLQGFIVYRWYEEYAEAHGQLADWITQGKLSYREHVTTGFENMRQAFYGMLKGDNIGKAVISKS